MKLCIDGLNIDNSRLRECSYCFFAILARVFEEEFSPFLTIIIPSILNSCRLEEKDMFNDPQLERYAAQLADDDSASDDYFNVNSAISEEKETSLDALAQLFSSTKSEFLPYVQDSINIALGLLDHYNESVRKSACACLCSFLQTFYKMSNPRKWEAGLPLEIPLHANVTGLSSLVVEGVLRVLEEEDDQ